MCLGADFVWSTRPSRSIRLYDDRLQIIFTALITKVYTLAARHSQYATIAISLLSVPVGSVVPQLVEYC